ncbi:hypothetical protein ABIE71_010352 [Bradyrhizobium diazoefficiens]
MHDREPALVPVSRCSSGCWLRHLSFHTPSTRVAVRQTPGHLRFPDRRYRDPTTRVLRVQRLVARQPGNALRHETRLPAPHHWLRFARPAHDLGSATTVRQGGLEAMAASVSKSSHSQRPRSRPPMARSMSPAVTRPLPALKPNFRINANAPTPLAFVQFFVDCEIGWLPSFRHDALAFEGADKVSYSSALPITRKRRSRPIRKGLAWGLQSVDQRVCKSLAGGMEAATTENYEVRPNDQGRSSSIRDCG